ncbi:MAG: hypothetical protein M3N53_09215 [Actinomycetota bacterium]|nr:hypothetical protein [Actinomycetota bacterium]
MKPWRLLALPLVLAAMSACRPDTVRLAYQYPADATNVYQMHAHATASWDIGGPGEGSYDVTFEVTETVESSDAGGVVVSVQMVPLEVEERGLPSPGSRQRSFALRIGPNGEVFEVLEVDGVPAQALDPDELAFIGTYRPPLPLEPVRLRDTWRAQQQVDLEAVFQQVLTTGRLVGLRRDAAGKVADVAYSGAGPLVWATTLPQGEAELTGSAETRSDAEVDIDRGFLRRATSSTRGEFDVRIEPGSEQAPIVGRLRLDLDLTLQKLEGPVAE